MSQEPGEPTETTPCSGCGEDTLDDVLTAFREYLCDVMCSRLDHAAWDLFNTLARFIGLYPNTGDSP